MYRIAEAFRTGEYVLLTLDKPITERAYRKIEIDGTAYELVPSYDLPERTIVIRSEGSFLGKMARLVL